jgi:hypothetical protein
VADIAGREQESGNNAHTPVWSLWKKLARGERAAASDAEPLTRETAAFQAAGASLW